mmetsp:Transcript_9690/g.24858  ORF Transcript_9690/g.24858 Transcript_9690/m.24858 type:complete len:174 (+) Transcript_9690:298-819(+)
MITKLYARGQDPNDWMVKHFPWKTVDKIPATNIYNMDEIGSDSNKNRKKKVGHKDAMHDGLKRNCEDTDGDNNPFHVTICMTTCKIRRRYSKGIVVGSDADGWQNPTGAGLFVSKSGSMTKERFPGFCRHFVENLDEIAGARAEVGRELDCDGVEGHRAVPVCCFAMTGRPRR